MKGWKRNTAISPNGLWNDEHVRARNKNKNFKNESVSKCNQMNWIEFTFQEIQSPMLKTETVPMQMDLGV